MLSSAFSGFSFAITLIVAIGAQNAFILRQGLRHEFVGPVVIICIASDAALIAAGMSGLGKALAGHRDAVDAIRWAGAGFLLCYAAVAVRRTLRPASLLPTELPPATRRATIIACLGFTYLNPHVYLDTVLLLGSVAHQDPHRWLFWVGTVLASTVWFTALGVGARWLAPTLARPAAWQVLDGCTAAAMTALALSLVMG